ncbi:MAG: DNA repair protein RecN [Bacillota bacterium]
MLVSLYIRDFGLIDEALLEPGPGLNVLTGETGAGKSIILDAMSIALGGRGSADFVRTGRDRALVQGCFQIQHDRGLARLLEERGIFPPEDDLLVMSRELSRSSRNPCRIGGQPVSLAVFREVGGRLADLQGQNEQQSLLRPDRQRLLLDRFAGPRVAYLLEQCGSLFQARQAVRQKLAEIADNREERARRLDFLQFQISEIDAAGLAPGEEESLAGERAILANAEKMATLGEETYRYLYAGEQGRPSAVDLLGRCSQRLEELAALDPGFKEILDQVQGALYQAEDASRDLAGRQDSLRPDPGRLEAVEERLYTISRLKKKYGQTIAGVLAYRRQAASEAAELEEGGSRAEDLAREVRELDSQYQALAREISAVRKDAAAGLERDLAGVLQQLGMPRVELSIEVSDSGEPSAHGLDKVEFMISPNPGEPIKPLAKIASGGELSRVLLAFKTVLAAVDDIPTMVFDEVDTGIGGTVLQAVAEKLAAVAIHRQVICVTHAPRVAALADVHFRIDKEIAGDATSIKITRLAEEDRVGELARMLGGRDQTQTVLEHARQMLGVGSRASGK